MKAAAKRVRKTHVQQELFRRGGKRKGAGRKPKGGRAGSAHQERPEVKSRHALHVVMRVVLVDPFSTGVLFPDWKELDGKPFMWPIRATYDPLVVRRPESWLLREGWKKVGGPISCHDVPSRRP